MRGAPLDPLEADPPEADPAEPQRPAHPPFPWGLGLACLFATAGVLGLLGLALYGGHAGLLHKVGPANVIAPALIDVGLVLLFAARHSRRPLLGAAPAAAKRMAARGIRWWLSRVGRRPKGGSPRTK